MKRKRFLPFIILILPLLFLSIGISYRDSFYYVLTVIALVFSLVFAIPTILKDKHVYLAFPSFRSKKRRSSKSVLSRVGNYKAKIKRDQNMLLYIIRSPFSLLLIGYILFFTYISIFVLPLVSPSNPYITYYQSYIAFMKSNALTILIPLILITLGLYFSRNTTKKKLSLSDYPKSRTKFLSFIVITLLIAFNISILSTFLFGIGEANLLAMRMKSNPGSVGIVWDKDKIVQRLKEMDHSPIIEEGGGNFNSRVVLIVLGQNNSRSKLYTDFILKNIPSNLIISPNIPNQPLVMFQNNLVINSLDKDEMKAVSPILGKLLVKGYFGNRYIKDEPNITVLGRQDYMKFREDQINKELVPIDDLINKISNAIGGLQSNIANDNYQISSIQNAINTVSLQKDSEYNSCLNDGYYFYGYFYHTYSQSYCDNLKATMDNAVANGQQQLASWQQQLQYDQGLLSQAQGALENLRLYRGLIASQKDTTPQELGLFDGKDNTIKIALDFTGSKSSTEYLETLSHEYLHYTSYISNEKSLDPFFEEGLTEYYARKVIKQDLGKDTNIGYPLLVKIIQQMVSKIPESTLQEIYFKKDQNQLQSALDSAYGKNFYEDSKDYFTIMSYLPPKGALKIANNIMVKIGGTPLGEDDLESTMPQEN